MTSTLRVVGLGGLGLLMSMAVTACVGTRPPPAAALQEQPAQEQPAPSAPIAEPAGPPPAERSPPEISPPGAPAANAVPPPCACAENKSKPKPKPKSKVLRVEAPPQLPTAPVVERTPPGGLIDAQVRSMSVSVMSILGKRVRGAGGEDLGRVVDVLADASGRVRTAIIDFGGFLGVGNHRVAVDWPLLRFNPDGSDPSLLLSLSPEKLRTAPEYKDNPRPQILMVPGASTNAPVE